jgi:hypothetical protein
VHSSRGAINAEDAIGATTAAQPGDDRAPRRSLSRRNGPLNGQRRAHPGGFAPLATVRSITRATWPATFNVNSMQPALDNAFKYKALSKPLKASAMVAGGTS